MSEPVRTTMPPSTRARWGMLVITLVMGAALVATAVLGYVGSRRDSRLVDRATVAFMGRAIVTRAMVEEPTQEMLESVLGEFSDQGLVYLALLEPSGEPRHTAGVSAAEPIVLPEHPSPRRPPDRDHCRTVAGGARHRCIFPVLPRGGRRHGQHRWGPVARHEPGAWLVWEHEPQAARAIQSRAVATLVVSLAAAGLLLTAAGVFWRLSLRAERSEAQLSKDRQLKLLGQMSAVLGHELRNPLTSLKGHAQLLEESLPERHPGRSGAETVVREAVRLEALTGQILDFAKTGSLERSAQDPEALARAAMERSGAAPIELRIRGDLPAWSLDTARMEQVLVNLLHNARQASPDGAPVELGLAVTDGELTLEVRDHGEGIAPGEQEIIFEPFLTTRARGTGLGLALAKRIVEGHGGRIVADNHPEGGALFRVSLPPGQDGG